MRARARLIDKSAKIDFSSQSSVDRAGGTMHFSTQYVIFNPAPTPLLVRNITIFNENSQNLNPVPAASYFIKCAPNSRPILSKKPSDWSCKIAASNSDKNGPSTLKKILPTNYRKILPRVEKSCIVENHTKSEVDPEKNQNESPPEIVGGEVRGVEGTVHELKRGLSCEDYNFCTKNKQRTR